VADGDGRPRAAATAGPHRGASEKAAKLTQKLGQLQPFIAVMLYPHRNAWANLHILGQPNIFLAARHSGPNDGAFGRGLHVQRHAARGGEGVGCCKSGGAEAVCCQE
jgi:hypothetical protein